MLSRLTALTGMDAAFLHAETPRTPMNVIATLLIDGRVDFESLVARVESQLAVLPPFRRRLVEMPLGLDHPAWAEDPRFRPRDHVKRLRAPAPGDDRALASVVERLARRRLDRSRPLWELWLVEGLGGERTALVVMAHHAAVDGVSGAAILLHLFDRPGPEATEAVERQGDAEPGAIDLLRHVARRMRDRPRAVQEALGCAGRAAVSLTRALGSRDPQVREAARPFQAPPAPWNGPLSPLRSVGYARSHLDAVQTIRGAFGGTVNDVVLTACTRALQADLLDRGGLPASPLVAAIPLSTRAAGDEGCGNRLSAFLTELPVQLEDPVHQLSEVRRAARRAKRLHSALGGRTLASLAELMVPGAAQRALDVYARWKLSSLHPPLYNLTVSNVPGPPFGLELFGIPVQALRPHGPLLEGVGLNVTVLSYAGRLDVGVLACGERVPHAARIADGVAAALEELAKLAEETLPPFAVTTDRVA